MNYQTQFGEVMQFMYFRGGIKSEMLARCQFGIRKGQAGATLTYPLTDFSWRYAIYRNYEFEIPYSQHIAMIEDIFEIEKNHPEECLSVDELYSDNRDNDGVTRERATHIHCHQALLLGENNKVLANINMRDTSTILQNSLFYNTIMEAVKPFETIKEQLPRKHIRRLP